MGVVFGNWKYIVRNLWYVLPFAIVPGILLAFCVDYEALSILTHAILHGDPRIGFVELFRAFNLIRIDSWLGAVYGVAAFIAVSVFMTLMLAFVEKHMRIGKRTLSGVFTQLGTFLSAVIWMTLVFFAIYEIWAVVLSAIVYVVFQLPSIPVIYIGFFAVTLALSFTLIYLVSFVYLFLPCKQVTGFRNYDAFLYSYRLVTKARWRIVLPMFLSFLALAAALGFASLLPAYSYRLIAAVLYIVCFLSFGVRMLTVYFDTDKLDREDLLKSYREF